MTWSVFEKGDVVYHPVHGKGEVVRTELTTKNNYIAEVSFDETPGKYNWFIESLLSFKPWPKPCHTRPFKEGWYLLYNGELSLHIRWCTIDYLSSGTERRHYFGIELPTEWGEEQE